MGDPLDEYLRRMASGLGWADFNAPASPSGNGRFRTPQVCGAEPLAWLALIQPTSPSWLVKANPTPPLAAAPAMGLNLFDSDIAPYGRDALNAALKTTFGEISAEPLDAKTAQAEAEAVASTIFNRLAGIQAARLAYAPLASSLVTARNARDQAAAAYEDLAKHPSLYKQQYGNQGADGYDARLAAAKTLYEKALKALGTTQAQAQAAHDKLIAMASYVKPSRREAADLNLADIVEQDSQYEGTKKGRADFDGFAAMSAPDQARNLLRWATARAAVAALAANPGARAPYLEFRANKNPDGSRKTLGKGRKRIGGNDFW